MKVRNSRSNSLPRALVELLHLRVGEHAGHQHLVLHAVHHHLHAGRGLASGTGWRRSREPRLHRRDLVLLRVDDPLGEPEHDGARAMGRRPARHHDRLRMVADHVGHEIDVGLGVRIAGAVGSCLGDSGGIVLDGGSWFGNGTGRLAMRAATACQHGRDGERQATDAQYHHSERYYRQRRGEMLRQKCFGPATFAWLGATRVSSGSRTLIAEDDGSLRL